MKLKYIYKYLIVAFVAVLQVACTSTEADSKFDQTPIERLNIREKELNDLLLSSPEGWKVVYYTDSTQLGGWTHLFKFLPDGKVDMASDFDGDTSTYRSQYDIQLGSSVGLVFTTANRIHLLSQSDNYPTAALRGKGYLGDFQFFYYGQENGDIIFKTNRNVQELRFVKAKAQDWTDLPKNTPIIEGITGGPTSPLFRLLEINDGSALHLYDFDFNANARFGTATSLDPASNQIYNLALSFTPTSAIAKPALVVKGQKISNFVYDSASDNFVATGTGGVSATIKYTNVPPTLTDDYKILLPGKIYARFGYYVGDYVEDAPTNSQLFVNELAAIDAALPEGVALASVQVYLNHSLGNFIYYTFAGRAAVFHYIDVEEDATGKKIILKHKSWNGNPAAAAPAFLANFDKHLVNASGVYVKKENFKLGYTNTVYTFTSASSSFRMTAWQLN
ncbi:MULTISPECIES: DUF4302 domain-containing protein [unclassified Flavobacterium]|jgi:hypothetical protein|uniref:DUF4302 domain-containing protein n=1 Tax=unclassified Flavobacterium TaxID=196869 RepID=UPI0012AAA7A1|nr:MULTISPECIES: DUF4302 domain-containing protein [unclassified Flavobacterium]MBF4483286.1 DUF4302 domain-containing protein [Flavobacterium sp. CSZ]QGK74079.1 DUF4302 domain-containing protein [Flavobacterium sp. SLB02]